MPPLAKVPKALANSKGVTTEDPNPKEGTASNSDLMPARCARSTTTGGPMRSIKRTETTLRERAKALRSVMVPRYLASKLLGTQILKSADCEKGAVAKLMAYWSVAPSSKRQSRPSL